VNIEKRSIPEEERHGSVRNLFTIWFSANMQITTLVTGALAVEFGLTPFWSIIAIVFLFVTVEVFRLPLPLHMWAPGHFEAGPFLLTVSIAATWQLTYAPYVADYSRYLPSNTPSSQTFAYTYAGTVIGTVWMMTLGVILTAAIPKFLDNSSAGLAKLVGPQFSIIMLIVIVLGVLAVNVLNLYGAFMSITTTLEAFTKLRATAKARIWLVLSTAIIGTALAVSGMEQI
jgi:nucleobase:cation symporter-1, NCS1 family